jgi:hypothetical protein
LLDFSWSAALIYLVNYLAAQAYGMMRLQQTDQFLHEESVAEQRGLEAKIVNKQFGPVSFRFSFSILKFCCPPHTPPCSNPSASNNDDERRRSHD